MKDARACSVKQKSAAWPNPSAVCSPFGASSLPMTKQKHVNIIFSSSLKTKPEKHQIPAVSPTLNLREARTDDRRPVLAGHSKSDEPREGGGVGGKAKAVGKPCHA